MNVRSASSSRPTGKPFLALLLSLACCAAYGQTGVLREVWTDLSGSSVSNLRSSPKFPTSPAIRDTLPGFSAPANFGDNYGQRLRAFIAPTQTGDYKFWIQGDDQAELLLSADEAPANAVKIASVPGWTSTSDWEKYPEQQSALVRLEAGKRYFIEALQKEGSGGDHLAVHWELPTVFARQAIPAGVLAPFAEAPAYDSARQLYVSAGADLSIFAPRLQAQPLGSAFVRSGSPAIQSIAWTQISGPPVPAIQNADTLSPTIDASQPGEYVFELSVANANETRSDRVSITTEAPLAEGTGEFIQEIWLDVSGGTLDALLAKADYPTRPHLVRKTNSLSGPRNWGDQYGARTRGFITPPATGDYTFWVSGDEVAALFLSPNADEADAEMIAYTPARTSENEWRRFPEQRSATIRLVKGQKYYLELLYVETWSSDYHAAAWSRGDGPIETISGEFFIPLQPETTTTPDFDATSTFAVEAGHAQELRSPDSATTLKGRALRIQSSFEVASTLWTQVSGPVTAAIATPAALETRVTLPAEGVYTFQLAITAGEVTASDVVQITRSPALSSSTGGFTREVWRSIDGSAVADLTSNPRFPARPDIVETISSLTGPFNWDDRYGSRLSGYIIAPRSGPYTFYLSSDDSAELRLSPTAAPAAAVAIASSTSGSIGSYRNASQVSAPINLVAGQRYYIEVLHKEYWGNDHVQVAWSYGDQRAPTPIGGGFLEPAKPGIAPINESLQEYAYAGPDRRYYAPTSRVELDGKILRRGSEDLFKSFEWTYLGDVENVVIDDPNSLRSGVTLPEQGSYAFRLAISASGQTHYDDVTITVLPPLADDTGGLLRAVWLNSRGESIADMLVNDPALSSPTFEDVLPNLEIPRNWSDQYATRLIGYIHPPATGDFTFWLAADDQAELWISSSDNPTQSLFAANITSSVNPREWDKRAQQKYGPVRLEKGKKYFVEVLHQESIYNDHLAVAWAGPGLNDREVITAGYLSPAFEASAFEAEILALAGSDATLLWPNGSINLAAKAFDQNPGPKSLTYQWSSTDERVAFSRPNGLSGQASFPGPGAYEVTFSATDGEHTASDSLTVTVFAPLDANAGSITRQVWLEIPGSRLSDLTNSPRYPDNPDFTDNLPKFEAPSDWDNNYGQRIVGYILPPISGNYLFFLSADDQAEVSLNTSDESFNNLKPIITLAKATSYRNWSYYPEQRSLSIRLEKGRRYPVQILHKESTGSDHLELAWKLPGSSKIEVIDGTYLAPQQPTAAAIETLSVIAPADILQRWPQNTVELVGHAYDYQLGPETLQVKWTQASGPGTLTFTVGNGLKTNAHISQPGVYTIQLHATDGENSAIDTMTLTVEQPLSTQSGGVTRAVYSEISGNRVVDLLDSPKYPSSPDATAPITKLDAPRNQADNYGAVVAGYLHAPTSGLYRFSIAGDDWVELFVSIDADPANRELICFTPKATDYYEWDKYPEYQTSAPVLLEEGERYYFEIRHKESSSRDHFSVAWLRPDREAMEIIEGGYLSPLAGGPTILSPKITLAGAPNVVLTIGSSFVDPGYAAQDGSGANITGLVAVQNPVDTSRVGSYTIRYQVVNPSTGFAEIATRAVEVVAAPVGNAVYSAPTATPPAPQTWTEPAPAAISANEASRFLAQATFGPDRASIARLQEIGYSAWIDEQISLPASLHRAHLQEIKPILDELGYSQNNEERMTTWWTLAIEADDQLRQRVAFALSEILVLSDRNMFRDQGQAVAHYYDILVRNAFGNYRDILGEVTLNPLMGQYLTMLRSSKASPDENYAREIMQLFSIGLHMLNPDGTVINGSDGSPVVTYDQRAILELSRAFTGWTFAGSKNFNYSPWDGTDYYSPMAPMDAFHDFGSKTLLGGYVLPQGLSPREDLKRALDHLFAHPNVGPFVARRLIQRLVSSNPSPAYIYRVTQAFNRDSNGQRGNLAAVVRAILLDPEARAPQTTAAAGKLREPIVRLTHLLRAFDASTSSNPPVLGRFPLANPTDDFAQAPLQAPSVFNFFEPDYAPPGAIMEAGLVAPEFGSTTELTAVDTANYLHRVVDRNAPVIWRYSASIRPNIANLIANAADTNAVLDELDLLLMSGSMSAATRAILKEALDQIDEPKAIADAALKLVITSPEYSVQK